MAKGKSKFVMIFIKSVVSGHRVVAFRPRVNEKIEMLRWDPYVQCWSVYKEDVKIRGAKH
ncbi:unnamed protein product [Oppiella nova]|uniref:Ribosomal protein L33 n=1 Tax=Oppiella nova TaxID=334625 RepID=A0A7R9MNU2_9ACAR|nr:unnamed protein product [Oppiella nova]CAG2180894.1 unnamed protein product [Oppiella nova]